MKKIILCSLLLFNTAASFSQQTQSQPLTRDDYLKKSKGQKTGAWLLAAGGGAIIIGSLISTAGVYINEPRPAFPKVPVAIGAACVVGSVPLFIAASKNKKRAQAATAWLKMERAIKPAKFVWSVHSYPALALKMNL